MSKNKSEHILNTSANLLGFCLFIITSVHISNRSQTSFIDDTASIVALLLSVSCFLSFASIRSNSESRSTTLETIADYFFLISLGGVLILTLLISLSII